jgi:hypothetical protein
MSALPEAAVRSLGPAKQNRLRSNESFGGEIGMANLEAHRRIATARKGHREKN